MTMQFGRKLGQVYVRCPINVEKTPGGDTISFSTLGAKVIPPLCRVEEMWVTVRGVQESAEELTRVAQSEIRVGQVGLPQDFDFNSGGTDMTLEEIAELFNQDLDQIGEDNDLDEPELRELGSASSEWQFSRDIYFDRRVFKHDFTTGMLTEANKVRQYFDYRRHFRNVHASDRDAGEPAIIAVLCAIGADRAVANTDTGDMLLGDYNPAELYREMLSEVGAYRDLDTASNILGATANVSDGLLKYMTYGNWDDDAGGHEGLSDKFQVTGQMTLRMALHESRNARILTIK